jgi:SAM-dependent methyltransferase
MMNRWQERDHAEAYLARSGKVPHRSEGEAALFELVPARVRRVLDIGSGDGRLLRLLKVSNPNVAAVALDFSDTMLDALSEQYADDATVAICRHDLEDELPGDLGSFDAVISSFAIHHLGDERKASLYAEIACLSDPGGVCCNLEHVPMADEPLHRKFLDALGQKPGQEDPSNKLASVPDQLTWLRDAGLLYVDCYWKWQELALMAGWRPVAT